MECVDCQFEMKLKLLTLWLSLSMTRIKVKTFLEVMRKGSIWFSSCECDNGDGEGRRDVDQQSPKVGLFFLNFCHCGLAQRRTGTAPLFAQLFRFLVPLDCVRLHEHAHV